MSSAVRNLYRFLCLTFLAGSWALHTWAQISEGQGESAKALPAIGCSLSTAVQPWQSGMPAIVSIQLKNDEGAPVDLDVVPYFSLESKSRGAYTSPVDIVANRPLSTNQEQIDGGAGVSIKAIPLHLHLDTGESAAFKVDANKTKWDDEFSAKWPSLPFAKVVRPGTYSLSLKLWVGEDSLECNKIEVRIQAAQPRKRGIR
jgi:hypothetical protein